MRIHHEIMKCPLILDITNHNHLLIFGTNRNTFIFYLWGAKSAILSILEVKMRINYEISENVPLILDLTNHLIKFGINRNTLIFFTCEVLKFAILSILKVKMWINHEISENVFDLTNHLVKFRTNRNTLIFYLGGTKFDVQNEAKVAQNRSKTFFEHSEAVIST